MLVRFERAHFNSQVARARTGPELSPWWVVPDARRLIVCVSPNPLVRPTLQDEPAAQPARISLALHHVGPEFVSRLGPDHELTMQLLTTRAPSEGSLGLWNDAIRDDLAIYNLAVRKQGPLSFFAVATLSDASLAECRAGRYGEGEANARRALEASSKAFGPRAGPTGGVSSTLAACLQALGANRHPRGGPTRR